MTGYPGQPPMTGQPGQPTGYPPQQGFPPQVHQIDNNSWYSQFYNQIANNPQMMQMITAWFQSVDLDRSGTITAHELANFQVGGFPIGYEIASKLIKVFDKDNNMCIDFNEYATMHQFLTTIQNAFYASDTNRSGTLDAREIHGALTSAGFVLTLPTVQVCVKKFDKGYGLGIGDFLLVCSHFAQIRSIFEWNDQQRRGSVTLNYDQMCNIGTEIFR
jgi:Ca2+-binding EF-hand superfamily protein